MGRSNGGGANPDCDVEPSRRLQIMILQYSYWAASAQLLPAARNTTLYARKVQVESNAIPPGKRIADRFLARLGHREPAVPKCVQGQSCCNPQPALGRHRNAYTESEASGKFVLRCHAACTSTFERHVRQLVPCTK
mmetsp:Transcript_18748/g.25232  ORF Transcript_18748/g.25232 Transcript_18748/m.25232 type:complete len:136 (+) Transcript_18748:471-878(+)